VIDLHCHILHGIDDGPAHMEESVELARALLAAGVTTVAATPHVRDDHPSVVPAELGERCAGLAARLAAESLPLEVVVGGEVDLLWAHSASADDLRLVSYGRRGTDLLVETPYGPLPPAFERALLALADRGFRLLLAHPERNHGFQRDPSRLAALVDEGVLVQVTADSLTRSGGSGSGWLAARLVREGWAHVIASDAHGLGRPFRTSLADGVAAAEAIAPARARWLVTGAPAAVLAGRPLEPPGESASSGRRRS
jgi:protein-tyrosine phosphatase